MRGTWIAGTKEESNCEQRERINETKRKVDGE
jgi:hypothetical protein